MASDPAESIEVRRLRAELEHTFKNINREHIGASVGPVSRATFEQAAMQVATMRGRYLKTVLELGTNSEDQPVDSAAIKRLQGLRLACNELMEGFEALQHALQRGYLDLSN